MGLVEKDAGGKYVLTEKGFDVLGGVSVPENMRLMEAAMLPQEIGRLDEVGRGVIPSPSSFDKVASEDIVSSLVRSPFVRELVAGCGEGERLFYAFLGELYLESLKVYGLQEAKFSKELFYRIRGDVVKAAVPEVCGDDVEAVRFRLVIEFAPSHAFDKILRRIPDPEARRELVKRKKEVLTEVFEKLYGIKVLRSPSMRPKGREDRL